MHTVRSNSWHPDAPDRSIVSGWYVAADGRSEGPFEVAELERRRARGLLSSSTLVWRDGLAGWVPASQSELVSLFAAPHDEGPSTRQPVAHALPPPPPPAGAHDWQQPPPPVWQHPSPPHRGGGATSGMSTAAIVCGTVAVLFLPIVLGPVAIGLAVGARRQGEPRAGVAMTVAVGGMLLGFVLGALWWGPI